MRFKIAILICFLFLLVSCDDEVECFCNHDCNRLDDVVEMEIPSELYGSCLFLIDEEGYDDVRYCEAYGQKFEYHKAYMERGYLVLAPNGYIKRIDGKPVIKLRLGVAKELKFYKCDENGNLTNPCILIEYEEKTLFGVEYHFDNDENFMIKNENDTHVGISTFILNNDY